MAEIPQAIQNHNGEEGMDVDTEEVKLKISFFSPFFYYSSNLHPTLNTYHPSSPNCSICPNCPL